MQYRLPRKIAKMKISDHTHAGCACRKRCWEELVGEYNWLTKERAQTP